MIGLEWMTERLPAKENADGKLSARAVTAFAMAARFVVLAVVASLFWLPQAASVLAQDLPVAHVEASQEDGFGRIVITFENRTLLPTYDARISSGVLRITFTEPVTLEPRGALANALSSYVSVVRFDPDGSGLRLALSGDARINTMEAGEKLFVDLLPASWVGMPPNLPDDVVRELAQRAEKAMRKLRALEQAALESGVLPAVDLRVGEHPTFSRLVFQWTVPFDSQFVREGDVVKVSFNHPVDLDISDLKVHLPQGVVDATQFKAKDRLNFLLRVEPSVKVRAFREGTNYVLDVVNSQIGPIDQSNAKVSKVLSDGVPGTATGVVTTTSKSEVEEGPDIVVAEDTEAQLPAKLADDAALASSQPAMPEMPATPAQTPAANAAAPAEAAAAPAEEPATIPVGSATIADAVPVATPDEPAAPDQAAAPTQPPRGPSASEGAAMPVPNPVRTVTQQPPVLRAAPEEAAPAAVAEATRAPETATDTTEVAPDQQPAEKAATEETVAEETVAEAMPEATSEPAPAQTPSAARPEDDLSKLIAENSYEPSKTPAPPPETLEGARGNPEMVKEDQFAEVRNFVSVEARRIGDTVRIVFPFLDPVASAVFRRGNVLWMIFDTDVPIDLGAARTALKGAARSIEQVQHGSWQTVRVELSDRVLTTVGTDGPGWILTIGEMILEPSRPLAVQRNMRGDGGHLLRIPFGQPVSRHKVVDPVIGDTLEVVTGFGPARGLLKGQSFVELETLSSAHGIAMVPMVDDLDIVFSGDDVLVQRVDRGLTLSNSQGRSGALLLNGQPMTTPSYGDLTQLVTPDINDYVRELRRRETALSEMEPGSRGPARLALAQFQVANSFASEALGMLDLLADNNPAVVNDAVYNLTTGAANVMASRPAEALTHLERQNLSDSPDAAVWRMMANVALQNWADARVEIPKAQAVIGNYPEKFQGEFNLAGAKALVELNDFGAASAFLSELDPTTLSKTQAARYDVLRGQVADAGGRSEEALRAFDIVARSADRPRAAEATLRALRIRYRDGGVDAAEAKKRLEGLTTIWRGDETELKALRFLAELSAENGDYRNAFEAMRAAVEAHPAADTTRVLQEEMNAVFSSLYLDGKADEMEPIEALSLYYDFRELTPIGSDGDLMVRRLADRLISVDLLDQAAELLQYQVDHRLKGVARAQIAADLALVYLLDRSPEKALGVLTRTRQAQLPQTLDRQRRLVEARALADTGRADLSMELISNLRGPEVDRLRADTLWQADRWQEAGEQLERMHGVRWADDMPLEDQERMDVLRSAIAYSFAGDQLGLNRLRSKYAVKMANSPSGAAFEVVTRPIDTKGVEFMGVVRNIAAVDTMESFLTEYRRHYLNSVRSGGGSGGGVGMGARTASAS